ncbi:MAG: HAD family hydrolase [Methanobrevibacter sp.]|uniref:HAD family hydrolase n=1 Tax=Methanobrevibacter sp. TaxID=66852 RepID=UPI0026DED694|nr:HAD family hydrolase [Methanobrevibacter sp.]MDO5849556.1 HAD family hydrolase [Methanobrevibacter sp.]
MKKAIVSDNSGTLLERYRAIKDIESGDIFTNINSLDLIESGEYLNLVVLQFDTTRLLDLPQDILISDIVRRYDIDFDVSFPNTEIPRSEVAEIIYNDDEATIGDIVDCFKILKVKIPKIELCNGSALIIDIKQKRIRYTITSAGKLFPSVKSTINKLQERGIEIFIASGDRKGAIERLAKLLNIDPNNAFGTVSTRGKREVVKNLQDEDYKVLMVGDGVNDILAFEDADISVLTLEQEEEVSDKLLDKTDFIIYKFSEILDIVDKL